METVLAEYHLPYGKTELIFALPDGLNVQVLAPRRRRVRPTRWRRWRRRLRHLVGAPRLADLWADLQGRGAAGSGQRRGPSPSPSTTRPAPCPTSTCCRRSWRSWKRWASRRTTITLVIATGTHAPMQPAEFGPVIPEGSWDAILPSATTPTMRPTWSTWATRQAARRFGSTGVMSRPTCGSSSATSSRTSSWASPAASRVRPSAWPASAR